MRPILLLAIALPSLAAADCPRAVQVRLAPIADLQMAVWIEDAGGHVVDTVFVTRSTGVLGLGNRPGHPRFKSDYRFPYGAREMVLPVWAHARGKTYPRIRMGGAVGPDEDGTIGYHFPISSPESFYCSPGGGVHRTVDGVDVVSCASAFTGAKGVYSGERSVYPPRADLTAFTDRDAADAHDFATENDLAAVSGATPPGGAELSPPLLWPAPAALPDGDYVVRVEVSEEADFNAAWTACDEGDPGCAHGTFPDVHVDLRSYGRHVLGQPSLVWAVPFTLDEKPRTATARDYQGYGDWDGATGALHPPDATISTDVDGSGARRLLAVSDGDGAWRVKVATAGCGEGLCLPPAAPGPLTLTPSDTSVAVAFAAPSGAVRPARYEVRYRVGAPLTNESFTAATPGDMPPPPGPAGAPQSFTVGGLKPDSAVSIGVRAIAACGAASPTVFATTSTRSAEFATLHGCFVATAAYGSPLAPAVAALRRARDQRLLPTPLGRLFVAAYYGLSPSLAAAIAGDRRLRSLARALVGIMVPESGG